MPSVVRLIGGVPGVENYPELAEQIGRYVVDYKPENAPKGEQWLWTTSDVEEARRFADFGEWQALYTRSIGVRPWDGKPDRPISIFHVEVTQAPA